MDRSPQGVARYSFKLGKVVFSLALLQLYACAGTARCEGAFQANVADAETVSRFSFGDAAVWQVAAAAGRFAVVLHFTDSSTVSVIDTAGRSTFRLAIKDTTDFQLRGVTLTPDGSTILVKQMIDNEFYLIRVFDSSGSSRFAIESSGSLLASPSGKLFCTLPSGGSDDTLELFGADGQVLRGEFPHARGDWACEFIDDSQFVWAAGGRIGVRSWRLGYPSWDIPLTESKDQDVRLVVSRTSDPLILAYTSRLLVALSPQGEELWRKSYDNDELLCATFEDSGQRLAVQSQNSDRSEGVISIISGVSGQPLTESINTPRTSLVPFGDNRRVHFANGVLSVLGPSTVTMSRYLEELEYQTLFVKIGDGVSGRLECAITRGIYTPASARDPNLQLFLKSARSGPELKRLRLND